MKLIFREFNATKPVLIAALFFAVFQANSQQSKPVNSGYAPVNGIKVYYEVYGKGRPIVLLHGAFMTIEILGGTNSRIVKNKKSNCH